MNDDSKILNTDPLEYQKKEFGKVGFDFKTIKANKEAYAEVFSEGSPALKKLLLYMWDHNVETKACCIGHEPAPHYYKTVSNSIIEIDKAEFDKHVGDEGYSCCLEEDCAYFTFMPQNNGNESYARYAVRKTLSQLKNELPISVECDAELIDIHLSRYVSKPEAERFFSSIHDAIKLYIDMQNISHKQELKSRFSEPSSKELAELAKNPLYLKHIKNQTPEICLCAVHNNGNALEFAKYQTPQICAEAIRNNPMAIRFVHNQTEDLCMQAVKRDGLALKHVRQPSLEVCKVAVQKNIRAVNFVPQQFMAHFLQAINQVNNMLQKTTRSTFDRTR